MRKRVEDYVAIWRTINQLSVLIEQNELATHISAAELDISAFRDRLIKGARSCIDGCFDAIQRVTEFWRRKYLIGRCTDNRCVQLQSAKICTRSQSIAAIIGCVCKCRHFYCTS